jgi:16S rRNA (cytosine1402-N4)-methyltransferase
MRRPAPPVLAGGAFVLPGGAPPTPTYHDPVLVDAVRAWAAGGTRAVDGTLGGGGHAALLQAAGAEVLALDRDPDAIVAARQHLGEHHIVYRAAAFAAPDSQREIAAFHPDRIFLDLGVSSHQLDEPGRGFSFRRGVPLDMRMESRGPSAADVLNTWPEERLATTFAELADWRPGQARRLAREIVRRRAREPFATSDHFVNAIRATQGPRAGPAEFAPLFQAVRIAVNAELEQLEQALPALRSALVPGGRLGVISYHSGEDRIVKHTFRDWARRCVCPRGQPVCTCRGRALGRVLTPRPVRPSIAEVASNPRARSARFRAFETDDGS